jgi:excisionase family DNA binding protein
MNHNSVRERKTLSVEEAAVALGIGRTLAYEAVRRGEIPTVRIGRRLLVPRGALNQLLSITATDSRHSLVESPVAIDRPHPGSSRNSSTLPIRGPTVDMGDAS